VQCQKDSGHGGTHEAIVQVKTQDGGQIVHFIRYRAWKEDAAGMTKQDYEIGREWVRFPHTKTEDLRLPRNPDVRDPSWS
jgi:hypothetical protein